MGLFEDKGLNFCGGNNRSDGNSKVKLPIREKKIGREANDYLGVSLLINCLSKSAGTEKESFSRTRFFFIYCYQCNKVFRLFNYIKNT